MASKIRLRGWGGLPARYEDKEIASSKITTDGRVIYFLVDRASWCMSRTRTGPRYSGTVVIVDGDDISELYVGDLDLRFPDIDILGDGFIVVGRREEVGRTASDSEDESNWSLNARVLGADGATVHAFHAGDGIRCVLTDAANSIWISYSDEASIYAPLTGNASPSSETGSDPLRVWLLAPVLIRWTPDGVPAWYIAYDKITQYGLDCYALNVDESRAWAYTYPGFGIVEVDEHGTRCVRRAAVRGARGIVVSGIRVGLLGSYEDRQDAETAVTLFCGDFGDGTLESVEAIGLQMPDGSWCRRLTRRVNCRGNRMWLQFDDPSRWYILEL